MSTPWFVAYKVSWHTFGGVTFNRLSRHRTRAAAERAVAKVVRRYCRERWPHRPEMVDVVANEYAVHREEDE